MNLAKAIKILKQEGAVVYPTDTVYGLGVDTLNLKAVKRMYQIKGRAKQPTHILVSGIRMAKKYVIFSEKAKDIFKKFLPGPLTIILPLKKDVPESIKLLSAGTATLGIRMADNKIALELVKKFGRPITTPSANPKDGKTPYSIKQSQKQFENRKNKPDLYLDGGTLAKIEPSTIIMMTGENINILRKGPIRIKEQM